MANPNSINFGPGQDKFGPNFYPNFNAAIDQIIETGALVGTDIVLTRYNAATINIPLGPAVGGYSAIYGSVTGPAILNMIAGSENLFFVDALTGSGAAVINLPTTPPNFYQVIIKDLGNNASVNNVTINATGIDKFDGQPISSYVISENLGAVILIYYSGFNSWRIVGGYNDSAASPVSPPLLSFLITGGTYPLPNPVSEDTRIVRCITNAGAISVTLPPNPTPFYKVIAKDSSGNAATNPITISAGGLDIDESNASVLINQAFGSLTFMYISGGPIFSTWIII